MASKEVVILNDSFFLRASSSHFYLWNLRDRSLIPEPFELTKHQYSLFQSFNGRFSIPQILEQYPKYLRKRVVLFIQALLKQKIIKITKNIQVNTCPPKVKEPHLLGIHFEITPKCNLQCQHCYQQKYFQKTYKDKLSFAEIKKLAKEAEEFNVLNISISGRKPFILPLSYLKNVFYEFEKRGIKVWNIFSNGTLLSKKYVEFLKSLDSYPHIIISLDGATPDTHGDFRGIPFSERMKIFQKILFNIRLLTKAGLLIVKINTAVLKQNLRELLQLFYLMKKLKIKMWRLAIPKFAGAYIENFSTHVVNEKELKRCYLALIKLFLKETKIRKNKIEVSFDLRISNVFKTEMLVKPIVKYSFNDSTCEYTRNRISIKHNGDVVPCGMLTDFVIGNIKKASLADIWYSPKMQRFKCLLIGKIKSCKKCKFVAVCGSGCRVNSLFWYGNFYGKDDDACKNFAFFDKICKLLKEKGWKVRFINKKYWKKVKPTKIFIKNTQLFV